MEATDIKTTHVTAKNSRDNLRSLYRNLTLAAQRLEEMKYVVGLRLGKQLKHLEREETGKQILADKEVKKE